VHTTFTFTEPAIRIDGAIYPGSEAYFQLMKSFGTPSHTQARTEMLAAGVMPEDAFAIGRRHGLRDDWAEARVGVMREAVRAKFTQSASLRALLQATHPHPLLHLKPGDAVWGTGRNGCGENLLGRLLVDLREQMRQGKA